MNRPNPDKNPNRITFWKIRWDESFFEMFQTQAFGREGALGTAGWSRNEAPPEAAASTPPRPGCGGGPPSMDPTVPATSCCSNNTTGKGRSGPAVSPQLRGRLAQLSVWTLCAACEAPRLRLACQSTMHGACSQSKDRAEPRELFQAPCPLGSLREGRLRVLRTLCPEKHWQNGPGDRGTVAPSMTSALVQTYTDDPSRAPFLTARAQRFPTNVPRSL